MKRFSDFLIDQTEMSKVLFEKQEMKNRSKDSHDKYFFSTILFFTNERDPKKNKTLENLKEILKDTHVALKVFVAEEVTYEANNNEIKIWDKKESIKIKDESNVDTIVIARLGAQDSEMCCECIKELQEWGLFVINPIQSAKRASNKYQSAVLMQRYEIPQPRFTLLGKDDIEKGMESLSEKLKMIYDNWSEDNKEQEYVVKLLDGHGGTGVFMCNNKNILAMLQAMFAVNEELELLLQKKEEADGGDIRVHVLTNRTEQKILACMKRVKLSGDFRSNVSLGASAEKVELTKEQEEIALKVARISNMPWCAVDIMPLKKGSNPEIGDNVVLEWNSSPGTDGISEVIGENFMGILLEAINDISELVLQPKSIGYREEMTFFIEDKQFDLEAKFDTGNGSKSSTLGCDKVELKGDKIEATINGEKYIFKRHGSSNPMVGQVREERHTVLIDEIKIGTRRFKNAEFALVDNRKKSTPVLINRDLMSKMGYIINPTRKDMLKGEMF
ncbi:MAG: hypothetical protein J1F35_05850 [Erysipelotrichales bacterium]|nr:hypothetical protein [Erysipelotrichales bacterium]